MSGRPIRVAIVGGGCAAMTAAFELSRREHAGRFEVTVFQLGWRLGGKGASGRGPAGRIEEHGFHVWMGWYENAFRLMRECYDELGRDPQTCPIAGWRDAFAPWPLLGVAEQSPEGGWSVWQQLLRPTPGLPGDPLPGGGRWTVRDYLVQSVLLLRTVLEQLGTPDEPTPDRPHPPAGGWSEASLTERVQRLLRLGEIATLGGLVHAAGLLELVVGTGVDRRGNLALALVDAIAANARRTVESRVAGAPGLRRMWQIADLTLATLRGQLRAGVLSDPRGFDALDEYDCREWLLLNGAAEASVDCGHVRALYDLGFAYEDGDASRPRTAAGQALRGMVRAFFTYRGAFFWRMQAGMGDVVFAPFYEVLRRRGVRFDFFHRLEAVRLSDAGGAPHVAALEFDVQAETIGGRPYEPLVDVDGLPCWPSEPDWRQLHDGERMRHERWAFESFWDRRRTGDRTLRVGRDFDLVVLAVGAGAIPHVARELVERDARWRAMVDHVKTVATQAFQVWLTPEMAEVGWRDGQVAVSGFVEPFDTWADMRHLLARERWSPVPGALAYFCNVLPDAPGWDDRSAAGYPAARRDAVRRHAVGFLRHDVRHLWPRATDASGEFRWDLLAVPPSLEPASGERRFETQFWTANVNPSDRYTLSLPGSSAYRISPLDRAYDNLTIAGDWTACGFNAGCVEAAVMSGRLAAHAICGAPALDQIVGYDHP